MNTLDCLVYTSRAKLGGSEQHAALADIIKVSAHLNERAGISGILTMQDGYFIQLLEGAPASLDLLMIHLHFDERHDNISIVARETISTRDVTGWSMIGPDAKVPPHPVLSQLLAAPSSNIRPWREAMIELLGVPA